MKAPKKKGSSKKNSHVTLKMVAERVGLTKGTCSAVLNKTAASRSVPSHTQERILAAARELNYRPSFYARNLGVKRTYTDHQRNRTIPAAEELLLPCRRPPSRPHAS
jgi:hypothetical protein